MGETTAGASEVFVPTPEGETPPPEVAASDNHRKHKVQRPGCKVQRSGPASAQVGTVCNNNVTPTTTTTDQLRISTGTGGVHDAASIATCIRAQIKGMAWKQLELCALKQVAMIVAVSKVTVISIFIMFMCVSGLCNS